MDNAEEKMNCIKQYIRNGLLFNGYTFDFSNIIKEIEELVDKLDNMNFESLPLWYKEYIINSPSISLTVRDILITKQGFCLLTQEFINALSHWIGDRKVLEVMAGCGSISACLKEKGVDIIATDNFSWNRRNSWNEDKCYWTDIENIDCIDAVKKYGKNIDIIIMSWAYMDDNAYKVLIEMRNQNPSCVLLFIGEDNGGCTADDLFYESVESVKDPCFYDVIRAHQNFYGVYDSPQLYK